LYLTGSENTIRRVTAETNYSCLMLKTQRFSSLFRHYAKYHGLRKDDLEYYFVNALENEDTPETVHLQRGDTIMVRKKRKVEAPEPAADDDEFFKDMRELLEDEEHMDALFLVYSHDDSGTPPATTSSSTSSSDKKKRKRDDIPDATMEDVNTASMENISDDDHENSNTSSSSNNNNNHTNSTIARSNDSANKIEANDSDENGNMVEIRAHKCILTARAEYFKALFRKGYDNDRTAEPSISFRESEECVIHVEPDFSPRHIRLMMEFIYTNRIASIKNITTDDLLCLLHLSDRWLIRDLKRLVEHELIREHMTIQSVARMYGATEDFHANRLSRACIDFIMDNLRQLAGNSQFEEEMKNYPHLCIPVLKAAAEMIPEGPMHKKQRTDHGSGTTATATPSNAAAAGLGSSPVPDSDP